MKKLFAIVLAVAMIAAMAIAVSAEDKNAATGAFEAINVTGTVEKISYVDAYLVTMTYSNTVLEYSEGSRTWNPANLTWGAATNGWVTDEATITITNKSSQAVDATITAAGANGVTLTADKEEVTVAKADKGYDETGAAASETITITASGEPAFGTTAFGTITVALV